ncbi:lasso peptide biosynthesis B2 protein [Hyphococcus luteus]|uniref:Microcin J25-processing protein McjB C-terminal domain-containing protein n=1 Tax=Hyphococcus luteus TaxID=2058213 RepID=A0A2S7K762_9PROT|nr:lasso peptide biosynthesis B2 protein [Marinicaulis flavus]PQA88316.1 hypothetical protein CW354_08430 [Marinicaulis flavus]
MPDNAFYLMQNVHFCDVDGTIVFLDANRNRYSSLTKVQSGWFRALQCGEESTETLGLAIRLQQRGLLTADKVNGKPIAPGQHSRTTSSLSDKALSSNKEVVLEDVTHFLWALMSTWLLWRTQRLKINTVLRVSQRWTTSNGSSADHADDRLARAVSAFKQLSVFFITTHDQCLFRSLLLVRFLALKNLHAELVFGVRTAPFQAHCWVESRGCALNEFYDATHEFTKILSL